MNNHCLTKGILSFDIKTSNLDSFSGSFVESNKDKNDNNINIINNKYLSISSEINVKLNLNIDKKAPSLILKLDKMLLNYSPILSFRECN